MKKNAHVRKDGSPSYKKEIRIMASASPNDFLALLMLNSGIRRRNEKRSWLSEVCLLMQAPWNVAWAIMPKRGWLAASSKESRLAPG